LKREFDAALQRAGRIWHIVHIMSLNPRTLSESMRSYGAIMRGQSGLSYAQREMLATVVASTLDCFY
jgi:alkylhydroperoxidase family enzyme